MTNRAIIAVCWIILASIMGPHCSRCWNKWTEIYFTLPRGAAW